MALLQIAEPGMSTAPHQHRLAVGIDLGTTNSLVAAVRSGISVVLSDEKGRGLLPSVVRYLADGGTEVGVEAQLHQCADPKNTIVSVKRFVGRKFPRVPKADDQVGLVRDLSRRSIGPARCVEDQEIHVPAGGQSVLERGVAYDLARRQRGAVPRRRLHGQLRQRHQGRRMRHRFAASLC